MHSDIISLGAVGQSLASRADMQRKRKKESGGKVELIATHRDKLDKIKKIYSHNCEL